MTDAELIKRLRGWDHCWPASWLEHAVVQAADRIEALTADNARLREALQVYANSCDATETSPCGYEGNMCCRTARAALTGEEPSHE